MIEESEQIIKETKTKLSELKQKEIEITTKMGTTEDGAAIDSYKAELIAITTSITQSRTIIRTSTETKIKYQESTSETQSKVIELKNKVETIEKEAEQAEEEAISTIEDGIEATYIVQKRHVHHKKQQEFKEKENEYK